MIITLQKNEHSEQFIFEIPSSLSLSHINAGEMFFVYLVGENQTRTKVEACFLADKRSLLVHDIIVPFHKKRAFKAQILRPVQPKKSTSNGLFGPVLSPMTGKIIAVLVKEEDTVCVGDALVVIEAMKMENRILAQCNGLVKNVKATVGMSFNSGDILLTVTKESAL